jgi:hypothetical protein
VLVFTQFTQMGELLVRAIETPGLLERVREPLAHAEFPDPDVQAIRDAAFSVLDAGESLDRRAVAAHLRGSDRLRSEKLLEEYPASGPLDLSLAEGREWFLALERFRSAIAVSDETRAVKQEVSDEGAETGRDPMTRLKPAVAERQQMLRPQAGQEADGAEKGASEMWNAIDDLDEEMRRRFPNG